MMIGARAENKLNDWHKAAGSQVKISSFEQTAAQVDVILDATDGAGSLNALVMVYPRKVTDGDHQIFISDTHKNVKTQVDELLKSLGWIHVMDLGDITNARAVEAYLLLWVRMYGALNSGMFNIKLMQ